MPCLDKRGEKVHIWYVHGAGIGGREGLSMRGGSDGGGNSVRAGKSDSLCDSRIVRYQC